MDLTVIAPLDQPSSILVQQVLDRFPARIENALEFARRSRVILITTSNGCPVDISIEGIVYRQRDALDVAIIRRWLQAFAELLDNPAIFERFERPWRRIHSNERPR